MPSLNEWSLGVMTTNNINRRETAAELAHLDHVLTDEELAHVVGGRVDIKDFSIVKYLDKASPKLF